MRGKLILLVAGLLVCAVSLQAQAAGIKKQPGESVTLSWTFLQADEPKISGFRVESAPTAAGPYTFIGTATISSVRQVVFPAAFSTGSVMVFYRVYSYFISGSNTVVSASDPVAGLEVDMTVPGPTATQVK